MKMKHASIIIPTYNRANFLADTIKSIQSLEKSGSDIEILVIDNASTDHTGETVREIQVISQYPLRYVREEKVGLHHSRHTGAMEAQGDILLFIDDDVYLSQGWLEAHLNTHNDSNIWAVGGPVLPHWEVDPPVWVHTLPKDYLSLLDYGNQPRPIGESEGINGCNYSIKRSVLFDLGGFHPDSFSNPNLIWYRGDGEAGLTKKILHAGGTVMYEPRAMLKHRIPPERLSLEYFLSRAQKHGIENAYSFMRKWNCALWATGALIFGGSVYGGWHTVRSRLSITGQASRISHEMASSRYWAIANYGWRLLNDPNLRNHVMRENYLD